MFNYDFMQNAFIAGTIVAIMAGYIGVFVMARNMSFISHTLSHVGFAGAAFAVFLGINPIYGLLIFTITMSYLVGHLSVKAFRREATVSVMLGIFLGLGLLFLSLTPKSTSYVNNILFGSVVSITRDDVKLIFILAVAVILLLSIFYRKIKFDSFDAIGARALGLGHEIGSLKVGKKADLTLVETQSVNMFPIYDAYAALVYSANATNVRDVWVDGVSVVKDKKLTKFSVEKLQSDLKKHMKIFKLRATELEQSL